MMRRLLPALVLLLALTGGEPAGAGETTATTASLGSTPAPGSRELLWKNGEGNDLVKKHCTGCHSEGRIMNKLQAMHGEQDENYEKEVKAIILRKIRMTNGDISRQDGKKIMEFLVAVWQRQKQGASLSSLPVS